MILAKMAFRNIFRHKRRSLFTGLMIVGAFTLFSVSLGVTEGSYSQVIEMFTANQTGHIQIHRTGYLDKPSIYSTITDYEALGSLINSVPEVSAWTPRLFVPALAFVGKKTSGVQIRGIDPEREGQTTRILEKAREGRFLSSDPAMEVMISKGLARVLGAKVNDELVLIGQGADGSVANDLYTIVGIVNEEDRSTCYMHIETARDFIFLQRGIHEIAIVLRHYGQAEKVSQVLREKMRGESIEISPWQVVEKHFYRAMEMDKQGNWITLFIIMLITAIGVLNTVLMTLLERTREFGILRAIGTRPAQIVVLILMETAFLALLSITIAGLISLVLNYLLSVYGISLPTPVELEGMKFESYVSEITPSTVFLPGLVTLVVAIGVSFLPALRASRVVPVKALRTE